MEATCLQVDTTAGQTSVALLADYDRWLMFLQTCRRTTRYYDRQLTKIGLYFPDFSLLSNYLRDCMRHRTQFFSHLGALLIKNADRLRADPTNTDLIQRLTQTHSTLQSVIANLTEAFADLEASYRTLPVLPTSSKATRPTMATTVRLRP